MHQAITPARHAGRLAAFPTPCPDGDLFKFGVHHNSHTHSLLGAFVQSDNSQAQHVERTLVPSKTSAKHVDLVQVDSHTI